MVPLAIPWWPAILCALALIVFLCLRNIYSYDYWWHAASGKWILRQGIMRADPFSFTARGAPLVDPYWLAQIVLYAVGGAVVLFKTAVVAAAFLLALLASGRRMRTSLPAAVLILLGAFVAHERFLCRPEMFTLLFSSVTLWILFKLSERKQLAILFVLPLTVLWANMHPGWVIGPLLLGAYAAGRLSSRWLGLSPGGEGSRKELLTLGVGALCFAAALINPYFTSILTYPFRLTLSSPHDVKAFLEWVSPLPRLSSSLFSMKLIHFKILAFALVGSFVVNYKRFDFGHAVIALLIIALSLSSYRHFGIFTITAIPVILINLETTWVEHIEPRLASNRLKFAHLAASLAVIITCIYYCAGVATNSYYARRELYNMSFGIGKSDTSFPSLCVYVDYTRSRAPSRIFNSYELGGYLIHTMQPDSAVFIDGRLVHYPAEVYEDYVRVQADSKYWNTFARKYRIDSVVLIHNLPRMQNLIKHLHKNPDWQLFSLDHAVCCYSPTYGLIWPEKSFDSKPQKSNYPEFTWLSLARFYVNVEEYKKAAKLLETKVADYPRNGKLQLYYGRALAGIGKSGEAKAAFENASQLLPDSAEAYLNLGVACWTLGQKDAAARYWRHVLEIDPRNEKALQYLRQSTQDAK